ncbi:cytochrome c-type biogenesis protein CcmE [Salmonella enterica subsp. enterica serovar Daytona]|uniref:Cytochrome c-type biogenesis protein CcmE n=1 Tax=Salmonella enterica subsp. enterica serovar Daytona TaxID=1962639 RepID=A0A447JFI9_SALET|nr:cytochrome c-type biogenesis protein CcmE [Salmonella enterica subsp. enterica serovar Daytona]
MNLRRKNRLWVVCAVLAGLALTTALVLYALRANIDLFYTPGEILYGKRETQQLPAVGQRLRVGGMVMPAASGATGLAEGELQPLRRRGGGDGEL